MKQAYTLFVGTLLLVGLASCESRDRRVPHEENETTFERMNEEGSRSVGSEKAEEIEKDKE